MTRYKLTLEYDGSRYNGWLAQKNERSIQGELMGAVKQIFGDAPFHLFGAANTEIGEHALAQVAHLDASSPLSDSLLHLRFNDCLPPDINVLALETTPPHFHALFDAKARSYVYQISKRRNAFGKKYTWWVKETLDPELMQQTANVLLGTHDLKAFSAEISPKMPTQIQIYHCQVHDVGDMLFVHIVGSHFLRKMVRLLVGMLVAVGTEQLSPLKAAQYIQNPKGEIFPHSAPPVGLFLERVYYKTPTNIDQQFKTLF
ncbi:MAG: tRNA pseudouridine(38-40) synthase TruA [Chitinophagales bacterium]|jgi:tRNA pseudouridine38-40 synthase|nr:tRNA pseudouridine(38-40) synthase TruA [Chitinophagales bacterium]